MSPGTMNTIGPALTRSLRGIMVVLCLLVVVSWWGSYQTRQDQAANSRAGCLRSTTDRHEDVVTLFAQMTGDRAVAGDPSQPKKTRDARRAQAEREFATAISKASRTAPTRDGRVAFCDYAFPPPPLIPLP